jgi:hypothetical protein
MDAMQATVPSIRVHLVIARTVERRVRIETGMEEASIERLRILAQYPCAATGILIIEPMYFKIIKWSMKTCVLARSNKFLSAISLQHSFKIIMCTQTIAT